MCINVPSKCNSEKYYIKCTALCIYDYICDFKTEFYFSAQQIPLNTLSRIEKHISAYCVISIAGFLRQQHFKLYFFAVANNSIEAVEMLGILKFNFVIFNFYNQNLRSVHVTATKKKKTLKHVTAKRCNSYRTFPHIDATANGRYNK